MRMLTCGVLVILSACSPGSSHDSKDRELQARGTGQNATLPAGQKSSDKEKSGLGYPATQPDGEPPERGEAANVLSSEFQTCFGKDAPLNAESYDCLDREYHRLDAVLKREYRAALARQRDETARQRLQKDERSWWRRRFRHCPDEVGDLGGSTATVLNENCEIHALAARIVSLRRY